MDRVRAPLSLCPPNVRYTEYTEVKMCVRTASASRGQDSTSTIGS
jgi:hypothetical protein